MSQSLLGNRQLLTAATRPGVTQAAVVDIARQSAPTVSSLYALALATTAYDSRATYVNRPLLFTNHAYPKPGKENVIVEATDIVANEIGVSLAAKDAFATRVGEGVRHTNAESLLHGPEAIANTADAFAQPGAWVALTASDETDIAALTQPTDARRRILDEVINGQIVVAPRVALSTASGPFAGWWRVDPATGTTLGFGGNGWGVAATEHSANSSRAGATGRVFINAFKRFTGGFIGAYAFCVAPKITDSLEGRSSIGLKLTITDSAAECAAQGAFWGALATLPLVALTLNRPRAPRVPNAPPPPEFVPPPEPPTPPCRGGTKVMPGRPGSGGTQPMPAQPPLEAEAGPSNGSSPPRGSPPPGPYQVDPAFKAWHSEASAEGQTAADLMGTPQTFEYADQAARSAYGRAVAGGANPAEAYQASHDAWFTAYRQSPSAGWAGEGTMQMGGSRPQPSAPRPTPAQPPSPSSLEMAETGAAPARTPATPASPPTSPPTESSPPRGSPPPGPYRVDPEFKDWHREAYAEGQTSAQTMGTPKTFEYADQAARSAYNRAVAGGANPAQAYQASHDAWFTAYRQAPTVGRAPEATVQIPGSPPRPSPAPAQTPSPIEMADPGAAPAPPAQPPSTPPSSKASSGPVPQRSPLPQRPAGQPVGPIGSSLEEADTAAQQIPNRPVPRAPTTIAETEAVIKDSLREIRDLTAPVKESAEASTRATEDFVKYRANKPRPEIGWEGDPENWDAATDQALQDKMMEAQAKNEPLAHDITAAQARLQQAQKIRDQLRAKEAEARAKAQACGSL